MPPPITGSRVVRRPWLYPRQFIVETTCTDPHASQGPVVWQERGSWQYQDQAISHARALMQDEAVVATFAAARERDPNDLVVTD